MRRYESRGVIVQKQLVATAILALATIGLAQVATRPPHPPTNKASQISNGKYIVENVAACSDCHTPKLPNGEPDQKRLLMGNRLNVEIPPTGRWTKVAPRIAGLSRWEDDEIVILLTTGKLETGLPMRAPMPRFHMTDQDARAVVAYLRSLSPPTRKKSQQERRATIAGMH
jgi:mono/diheme cytochrome c family protein